MIREQFGVSLEFLERRCQLRMPLAQLLFAEHRQGRREIPFRQRVLSLTVSIGICHKAGRDLYALLSEADRQLYLAKAAGRNRVALQSHVPA